METYNLSFANMAHYMTEIARVEYFYLAARGRENTIMPSSASPHSLLTGRRPSGGRYTPAGEGCDRARARCFLLRHPEAGYLQSIDLDSFDIVPYQTWSSVYITVDVRLCFSIYIYITVDVRLCFSIYIYIIHFGTSLCAINWTDRAVPLYTSPHPFPPLPHPFSIYPSIYLSIYLALTATKRGAMLIQGTPVKGQLVVIAAAQCLRLISPKQCSKGRERVGRERGNNDH